MRICLLPIPLSQSNSFILSFVLKIAKLSVSSWNYSAKTRRKCSLEYEVNAHSNSHPNFFYLILFKSQKVLRQSGISESVKERGWPNGAMWTSQWNATHYIWKYKTKGKSQVGLELLSLTPKETISFPVLHVCRKRKVFEQHWNSSSSHHILLYDTKPGKHYTFKIYFLYQEKKIVKHLQDKRKYKNWLFKYIYTN